MSERKKLTKVAKGIAFGDVSNAAIRNILTEISRQIYGDFTQQAMEETMEYFNWHCPYTDVPLKDEYDKKTGNYATDHIYPQNRIWCGLNVKGNLVLVSKLANSKKRDQSVDDFLLYDTEVLGCLDEEIRRERLDKIKAFQKDNKYDPEKIKNAISCILKNWYDKVRENQEILIKEAIDELGLVGIYPSKKTSKKLVKAASAVVAVKDMDDFRKYLIEDCGLSKATTNSYKNSKDKIMSEMGISDSKELESRIDEAIDYCSKEKEVAKKSGDSKKEKHYNDCRSAIRKYKDFLKIKESSI